MNSVSTPPRPVVFNVVYGVLNPIPFGFFVAALIFDVIYAKTAELMWTKSAAWLLAFGLFFAVIPRLMNLVTVWVTSRRTALPSDKVDFLLSFLAIVAAIVNSFVHSRDAYAVVPEGLWLSICTVVLLTMSHVVLSLQSAPTRSLIRA